MEFMTVNLNTATEEELISCLEKNITTAKEYRQQIAKLKQLKNNLLSEKGLSSLSQQESLPIQQAERNNNQENQEFEEEIDYYYALINRLNYENIKTEIDKILPSKENVHYEKIMLRLQAELLKSIKEAKDYLHSESLNDNDIKDLNDEISFKEQIIKLLISHMKQVNPPISINKKVLENSLIFVPTISGRIRVFDEIDSMPLEYYDELKGLFLSIKNATFKGVKRFQGDYYSGISEVRGKLMRVVFTRLNSTTYAVLTTFAKKFDSSSAYRSSLDSIVQSYRQVENQLFSNLDNPDFLALQEHYQKVLEEKLSISKENPKVKQKVIYYE